MKKTFNWDQTVIKVVEGMVYTFIAYLVSNPFDVVWLTPILTGLGFGIKNFCKNK